MRFRRIHNPVIAAVGTWWLSNIIVPAKAFYYVRAAERDLRDGFPYTAAMEWQNAAELLPAKTRAVEYCWRRWEQIMHLPRRLAGPITDSPICGAPTMSAPTTRPASSMRICSQLPGEERAA